jgi:metallo-beta-lactamase family protein
VEIFLKHTEEYSDENKALVARYGSPLTWAGFSFALTSIDSKKINDSRFPVIIISSSGMATGGRVLHHLAQRLPDPRNQIVFIGFQAPGTRGAIIKSGALGTFKQQPAITYLVHGEPDAATQLRDLMRKELGWNVQIAQWMERVEVG